MTGARELLRTGQARRPGAHDRHLLARLPRRGLRGHPTFGEGMIDDLFLDLFDRHGRVVDVEDAGLFAGRGTDASGELRKIVRGVEPLNRVLPAPAIDEVVPVGDDVPERTALVAKGDAAVHAARALLAQLVLRELALELAPILQTLFDRPSRGQL